MSILNFVNQDQLDELDEDPKIAFMQLVNLAQRSLHEQTRHLDEEERSDFSIIEEKRYSFLNVILASAKNFEIEPFLSMDVPNRKSFDMRDFDQFKFDLDHYVTQLVLNNSLKSRKNSVEIPQKSKDSIRGYIHALRDCIEKSTMPDKKRESLLKRLDALELELEKRRLNMIAVAQVAFAIWAVPGAAWQSYDVANKLLSNLMSSVAEAKATEESQKKIQGTESIKALSAPRTATSPMFGKPPVANPSGDLDDDIPF